MKRQFTILLLFTSITAFCQTRGVSISANPNGSQADPSAMLDIQSTKGGLLPPRMTTVQRDSISNPATGLQIFNTDCGTFNYFNGSAWLSFGTGLTGNEQPTINVPNGFTCQNSIAFFSISPVQDATNYIWKVPAGDTIISGQGTTTVSVNIGNNANSWVSVQVLSACDVATGYANINLYPILSTTAHPATLNQSTGSFFASWDSVPNFNYFQVDAATDSLFSSIYETQYAYSYIYNQNTGCCGALITGLNTCQDYYYRVETFNNCGESAPSNIIYVPASYISPPIAYSASNIDGEDFTANWQFLPGATDYNLEVATDPGFANPVSGSPFNTTANSNAISGLACNTTYYYRVWAENQNCSPIPQSNYSDTIMVTTGSSVAYQPGQPSVSVGNVCTNQPGIVFSTSTVNGANSYIWSGLPADATITGGVGSNTITVTMGSATGIYSVSVVAIDGNSCPMGLSSAAVADTVSSAAPSPPGTITGDASVCPYAMGELYSVAPVTNAASYLWTYPSDASIVSAQNNNTINVSFGTQSGNICVSAVNGCGTSSASCTAVSIINPSGAAPVINNQPANVSLCYLNTTSASFSVGATGSGLTYQWQLSTDGGNTFANLLNGGAYSNVNSATLNISGLTISMNNYQYRCVVGPCPTSISNAATLTTGVTGSQAFNYIGRPQVFTVPACVNSVTIQTWGAQGANGNGGLGGYATGNLSVSPGGILYVYVGGQNGWNGGGIGSGYGGNGGDESDVRLGNTINSWEIVAGGGGGGSTQGGGVGGAGGMDVCSNGAAGAAGNNFYDSYPGSDGTCTIGGTGGQGGGGWTGGGGGGGLTSGGGGSDGAGYGNPGGTGTQGIGGGRGINADYLSCNSGCGGGGGYYGGGGTGDGQCAAGSGGGGSSWASPAITNVSFIGGVQSGNGQVIISW